jgi:hypothetical protein
MRRLVDTARSFGARVLLLDFPLRRTPGPGDAWPDMSGSRTLEELLALHARYQDVVARVARDTGTPFVRTEDELVQSPDPPFTEWDLSHPNPTGARIIAERVFEELITRSWLTPATSLTGG